LVVYHEINVGVGKLVSSITQRVVVVLVEISGAEAEHTKDVVE
jgi:hypothetical protein